MKALDKQQWDGEGDLLAGDGLFVLPPQGMLKSSDEGGWFGVSVDWVDIQKLDQPDCELAQQILQHECNMFSTAGNRYWYWYPDMLCWPTREEVRAFIREVLPILRPKHLSQLGEQAWLVSLTEEARDCDNPAHLGAAARARLGHPYGYGTGPADGCGELQRYGVRMDNGAFLIGVGWVWFNK